MKKLMNLIVGLTFISILFSCGDDCDNSSGYLTQVELENTNWRTADSTYNASMTIENCEELNRVTEIYVNSLMSISDCISEDESDSYNSQLRFLTTSIIEDCN